MRRVRGRFVALSSSSSHTSATRTLPSLFQPPPARDRAVLCCVLCVLWLMMMMWMWWVGFYQYHEHGMMWDLVIVNMQGTHSPARNNNAQWY